ncbi:YbaB/EbfC family nucleoid-associated protein [Nocardia sp. NPDC005746]|uniref:YbaB/EbfC family nucleoid-associated protein n=1 Tax=Nocardia sp. NPDC005746 TaxID=3157062 RepID=UPI0033CF8E34
MDQRRARAEKIDEAIGVVRAQARAADRSMAIEVDAYGQITQIRLAPHAAAEGTQQLERTIIEQYRAARADAETQAHKVYEQFLRNEKKNAAPAVPPQPEWADPDDVQPVRLWSNTR